MSEALELVLRYFVTFGCGWLATHGLKDFDNANMVAAVTSIAGAGCLFAAMMARGLYKSMIPVVLDRLAARHKPALVAKATEVVAEDPTLAKGPAQ